MCLGLLLSSQFIGGEPETIYRRVDIGDPVHHDVVEGDWHQEEQVLLTMKNVGRNIAGNQISKDQRNFLMDYYNGVGSVPWKKRQIGPKSSISKEKKKMDPKTTIAR